MKLKIAPLLSLLLACTSLSAQSNVILDVIGEGSSLRRNSEHPVRATDGYFGNYWRTSAVNPAVAEHWISWELDAAHALSRLVFWTEDDKDPGFSKAPEEVRLQTWDGSNWIDLQVWTGNSDATFDQAFAPVVAGQQIRLFFKNGGSLNTDGQFLIFPQIELYGVPHALTVSGGSPDDDGFLVEPSDSVSVQFNAPVSSISLGGIVLRNLSHGTAVSGIAAAVSGDTLTVSHSGLVRGESYQLEIPAGAIGLSGDPGVLNAPIIRTFSVAPPTPRILSAPTTMASLAEDLVFSFDRPVSLVDSGKVRIWNITTQSPVSPSSVFVSGNRLIISHPGLAQDQLYRLVLEAGAIEGNSNGEPNAAFRGGLLAGEYLIYENAFDSGKGDVSVASDLGIVVPKSTTWQWTKFNNFVVDERPEDIRFMIAKSSTNNEGDFMALPSLDLVSGETYSITFDLATSTRAGLYQNDTRDVSTADKVLDWKPVTWGTSRAVISGSWTSDRSGPTYLMFAHEEEGSDIKIDNIELVRNFPPAIQVDSPAQGLVLNEGDPVRLDIDAFGMSGVLTSLKVFDGAIDDFALIHETTSGRVDLLWDYDTPGHRLMTIEARDERGEVRTVTREVTINFADGTLDSFLQWDFDNNDPEGVTTGGQFTAEGVKTLGTNYISLPSVFLFAGETYSFQFDVRDAEQGGVWGFEPLLVPGFPANADPLVLFDIENMGEGRYSTSFSVPADGPYFLTLYSATGNEYRNLFDNLRLIGTFNSAPMVTVNSPSQSRIDSIAGASITVSVSAEDSDGTISAVEFRSGGILLQTVTEPDENGHFVFTWDNIPFGENAITARAIDDSNGFTDSSVIMVNAARDQLRISTYLGQSAFNDFVYELEYQSDGTLLMAAAADPSLFPGNPPVHYLNGTSPGDTGILAVLEEDGRSVRKVVVLGSAEAVDLSIDGSDRIFVALGADGFAVMDPAATHLLHAESSFAGLEPGSQIVHRINSAPGGAFAILLSSTSDYFSNPRNAYAQVYDSSFTHLADLDRIGTFTADIAVDEANEQVFFVGYKNITTDSNPVDIPTFWARSYSSGSVNALTFRGYDWGGNPGVPPQPDAFDNGSALFSTDYPSWSVSSYSIGEHPGNPAPTVDDLVALAPDAASYLNSGGTSFLDAYAAWYASYDRWLNRNTNNMADTRGERVEVRNGKVYATFEFDGGNTPLRYESTSLDDDATGLVSGIDPYNTTFNTSTVPKAFIGIYDLQGLNLSSTWTIARLGSGLDNTIRQANGDFAIDEIGRIHTVGASAFGLPVTRDHFPGGYTGGAYYLVYSPDLQTREFVGRVVTNGANLGVAVSPNGLTAMGGLIRNESRTIFLRNEWDGSYAEVPGDGFNDAYFAVGDFRPYFTFQVGEHPRLFFSASDLPALRDRLNREPFASMYQRLHDMLTEQAELEAEPVIYHEAYAAMINGFFYQMTGDDAYAAAARSSVEFVVDTSDPDFLWADPSIKGLRLNQMAVRVAAAYDWCVGAPSWEEGFVYRISRALLEQGRVIIENGGTEQNTNPASNWQGARGSSGALALLASDHIYDPDLLDSGHSRTLRYLDANFGNDASSQGWTPEGIGYFGFPVGDFVGPYGIAMARHDPARDLRDHIALSRSMASIYTTYSKALNVLDYGGMKLDWADDHVHTRGNGVYNLGFYYADPDLIPGIKYWYDRTQGAIETDRARWDELRAGPIWAYLFYPEDLPSVPPHDIFDWTETFHDDGSQGIGLFTFRNEFTDENDNVVQFNARTRYPGGHNGPDGLGFRIIAEGNPFIVGGGRNQPGKSQGQPSLYPDHPITGSYTTNNNTGSIIDAEVKTDGSGHVIARMDLNNFTVFNHTRRFVVDYDETATGAAATFLVADTSDNGRFFQLPTYLRNSLSFSGNSFTFTAPNGATLKGTILHPASGFSITTGTMIRGNGTAFEEIFILENGPRIGDKDPVTNPGITENGYLLIEGDGSGDFLIAMTVQPPGVPDHPTVSRLSGTVADAVVQVGTRSFTMEAEDILYDGASYAFPDAIVTFDLGSSGSQDAADATPLVQSVARGAGAVAPHVIANPGYLFSGWNKAFDQVARSMTVSALYDPIESIPGEPAVFHATATGGTTVALSWEDRSTGETGFEVQRRLAEWGTWATIATLPAESESFSDSGLQALTGYEYQLRALGTGGDSAWVGPASVTTLEPNEPPSFNSTPVLAANQGAIYSYTAIFSDPEADPVTATAPTLPGWLDFTPVGSGQAVLSGIPGPGDLADNEVLLRLSDGINAPVEQAFTLSINAGPTLVLMEPGASEVYLADATHGLFMEATASDPDGVHSAAWSQVNQSGTALFDDPTALSTGVFFDQSGDYTLRLTASDGLATNAIDLLVHVGTQLQAEPLKVVDFGSSDYLAEGRVQLGAGSAQKVILDLDGDSFEDDALVFYPFSESSSLSPHDPAYNTNATSAVFYGGIVGEQIDKTSGLFGDNRILDRNPDPDWFDLRFQPGTGNQGLMDFVLFWKKEDFLNGADSRTLVLDADSSLSLAGLIYGYTTGRWLVKSNGQFYVSQSAVDPSSPATLSLSGTLLQNEMWAPYAPSGTDIDFDQHAAAFSHATSDLTDITAVGFLFDMDVRLPVDINPALRVRFDAFTATLSALEESNTAPVLTGDLTSANRAHTDEPIATGILANDDGLPAFPGSLSYQWSTHSGPEAGLWTNATQPTASVSYSTVGDYSLQIAVDDGEVIVLRRKPVEIISDPYSAFMDAYPELTGSDRDRNADPNQDGLTNEWAFFHDVPPVGGAARSFFLTGIVPYDPLYPDLVIFEFRKRSGTGSHTDGGGVVSGLAYQALWSENLTSWADADWSHIETIDQLDGSQLVRVGVPRSVLTQQDRIYFRLRIGE